MSYTEVFGGENINPTLLSYILYDDRDESFALTWPIEAPPNANVAADKIDVEMDLPNLVLTMPPANQVSVGQDILIRNIGAETFTVDDFAGAEIGSLAPGEAWFFVVTDNETEGGEWYAIEFGAGTSSATAASLAGAGLRALANRLDQNIPTTPLLANYQITQSDRATLLQSTGGALAWTFDSCVTLGDGFLVYIVNAGSGSLTLTPDGSETIDGGSTKVLAPDETCIIFSDGSNLYSVGYGRSIVSTVTAASIDVAGSGTLTLNSAQVAAQIQDYTGTLTGNRTINYGAGAGFWLVFNNTAGAFSLTLRVDNLDAGAVITQGSYSIVRSNGTNLDIAFTATVGTVTQVNTGTGLTGGPITTTGTVSIANTTVVAGNYGSVSETLTASVNAQGQLTALADVAIAISGSQVTDLSAIIAAALLAAEPIGTMKFTALSTYASGWLKSEGTIGNASSNATARANADTVALFTALWNDYSALGTLAIFTSAGAPSTFGANAAADYAANKALSLPDVRGRVLAHDDNGAGRLTNTTMTPDGTTLGATGGFQTRTTSVSGTISGSTSGSQTITGMSSNIVSASLGTAGGGSLAATFGDSVQSVGSHATDGNPLSVSGTCSGTSASFITVQPTLIVNCFIKYA